ncbi:MAG: hypothetical protein OYG31_01040 [Candidatus Kaiserbacteria bacterium]|nr:hypothetical protein [Candidatus Kaiserbacteria bacterium]
MARIVLLAASVLWATISVAQNEPVSHRCGEGNFDVSPFTSFTADDYRRLTGQYTYDSGDRRKVLTFQRQDNAWTWRWVIQDDGLTVYEDGGTWVILSDDALGLFDEDCNLISFITLEGEGDGAFPNFMFAYDWGQYEKQTPSPTGTAQGEPSTYCSEGDFDADTFTFFTADADDYRRFTGQYTYDSGGKGGSLTLEQQDNSWTWKWSVRDDGSVIYENGGTWVILSEGAIGLFDERCQLIVFVSLEEEGSDGFPHTVFISDWGLYEKQTPFPTGVESTSWGKVKMR